MDVLAFPFRLTSSGAVTKVAQGSVDHLRQQAVQFVSTRPNELPLAPAYGLTDPLFRTVYEEEIVAGLSLYHPTVQVDGVSIVQGESNVNITVDVSSVPLTLADATPDTADVIFNA